MKKTAIGLVLLCSMIVLLSSSRPDEPLAYISAYKDRISAFRHSQFDLIETIRRSDLAKEQDLARIRKIIHESRLQLKELDFWMRYLEPTNYKKINGPLPVEWETEVFEKYEAPYKREGAGLTLAELYLDEENLNKDSLTALISASIKATDVYLDDSITVNLNTHHHFFLANRLYLLNLAAIYTTGYECPRPGQIVPELIHLMNSVKDLYGNFSRNFQDYPVNDQYLALYEKTITFVKEQPADPALFDHFRFIRDHINPLYRLNQQMIIRYKVRTTSFVDYSLNKYATSIFDKNLYRGQNQKGVYIGIADPKALSELKAIGKLLFFDPILSGNNKRSCATCHKPGEYFTDTSTTTHLRFDQEGMLTRNTPSLVNAVYNHLLMVDGKHINLENQALGVITNPEEMGATADDVLQKVLSCEEYKKVFKKYMPETPQYKNIRIEHIASAIMLYYSDFSQYYSPFDQAIQEEKPLDNAAIRGFNLFMNKAQCATCHFVPQFNGVKPPYVGSEFEVLGVPSDNNFTGLSADKGRYLVNPAKETQSAFRTGSVRNAAKTKPYMHNGVFKSLDEVVDFYDAGGGAGRGLKVSNQTLSPDSLKLTKAEKSDIIAFIKSLDEDIPVVTVPLKLPKSKKDALNNRKVGGEY